ncbi:hypothetical protein [Acholeplasma granularum]|uniref:hypothetical protein n=1 Tax=Acholeplasma granularum TaxID=264635 RepID=UPI00046F7A76|nr:hypothetical protein [Acholeplasma granularum]
MKQNKILNKIYQGKLEVSEAYNLLFTKKIQKVKKSRFVKLSIWINENKFISGFVKMFTIFPIHVSLLKLILNKSNQLGDDNLTKEDIIKLISVKGISIKVITNDVKINIKTI